MATKYIPANKNEVQLFRRNRAIKERKRQEITDKTLIELRRFHLTQQKKTGTLEPIAFELNNYIKKQSNKRIIEVINYFLADIN